MFGLTKHCMLIAISFFTLKNLPLPYAIFSFQTNVHGVNFVHYVMSEVIRLSSVNIGCVACARKEMIVNFFTNMIWKKCLNATFT